jgi:hypothetical protein
LLADYALRRGFEDDRRNGSAVRLGYFFVLLFTIVSIDDTIIENDEKNDENSGKRRAL